MEQIVAIFTMDLEGTMTLYGLILFDGLLLCNADPILKQHDVFIF